MNLIEHENIGMFEEYKLYLRNDNLFEIHHNNTIQIWSNIKSANRKRLT